MVPGGACDTIKPTWPAPRAPRHGATRGNAGRLCATCAQALLDEEDEAGALPYRFTVEAARQVLAWSAGERVERTAAARRRVSTALCTLSTYGRCAECQRKEYSRMVARRPTRLSWKQTRRNRGRICRECLTRVVLHLSIVGEHPVWDTAMARETLKLWPATRRPQSSRLTPGPTA